MDSYGPDPNTPFFFLLGRTSEHDDIAGCDEMSDIQLSWTNVESKRRPFVWGTGIPPMQPIAKSPDCNFIPLLDYPVCSREAAGR